MIKNFLLFIVLTISSQMASAASADFITQAVTVTTTSTKVLERESFRNYLLIQNKGSTNIMLKFDSAHVGSEGITIVAGGAYEPIVVPTNALYLKASSGSDDVEIYTAKK